MRLCQDRVAQTAVGHAADHVLYIDHILIYSGKPSSIRLASSGTFDWPAKSEMISQERSCSRDEDTLLDCCGSE